MRHEANRRRRARGAPARLLLFAGAAALAPLLALSVPAPAQVRAEGYVLTELSPSDEAAIERGLDALVRKEQEPITGAFGARYRVASTSLAGLALLCSGDHVMRGPRAEAIEGAVRYLLSRSVMHTVRSSPKVVEVGPPGRTEKRTLYPLIFKDADTEGGQMHSHGYAVLFLAQVYGHSRQDEEIGEALRRAVYASELAQTKLGGYGYYFRHEAAFKDDEASTTVTQIQALRAARNAGIHVDTTVIDRAVDYVRRSMDPQSGAVCYSLTTAPNRRTYELTAAAVSTLHASGVYASEELARGLGYMRSRQQRFRSVDQAAEHFYFYGNLYAAQAMFQAGGRDWERWFPPVRQALLDKQRDDGTWESERFGDAYATACSLIILQMPRRLLPFFQR